MGLTFDHQLHYSQKDSLYKKIRPLTQICLTEDNRTLLYKSVGYESIGRMISIKAAAPAVVGMPANPMLSFNNTGMPKIEFYSVPRS